MLTTSKSNSENLAGMASRIEDTNSPQKSQFANGSSATFTPVVPPSTNTVSSPVSKPVAGAVGR